MKSRSKYPQMPSVPYPSNQIQPIRPIGEFQNINGIYIMEDEYSQQPTVPNYKVLVIGSTGAGKTSLTMRFAEDKFQDNSTSNLSVDFVIPPLFLTCRKIRK
jgi:GTPase SAR1 family protein